jgi:hypothetical protein
MLSLQSALRSRPHWDRCLRSVLHPRISRRACRKKTVDQPSPNRYSAVSLRIVPVSTMHRFLRPLLWIIFCSLLKPFRRACGGLNHRKSSIVLTYQLNYLSVDRIQRRFLSRIQREKMVTDCSASIEPKRSRLRSITTMGTFASTYYLPVQNICSTQLKDSGTSRRMS